MPYTKVKYVLFLLPYPTPSPLCGLNFIWGKWIWLNGKQLELRTYMYIHFLSLYLPFLHVRATSINRHEDVGGKYIHYDGTTFSWITLHLNMTLCSISLIEYFLFKNSPVSISGPFVCLFYLFTETIEKTNLSYYVVGYRNQS